MFCVAGRAGFSEVAYRLFTLANGSVYQGDGASWAGAYAYVTAKASGSVAYHFAVF